MRDGERGLFRENNVTVPSPELSPSSTHTSAMRPLPNEPATYALPSIGGGLTAGEATRAVHIRDGTRGVSERQASERLLSTSSMIADCLWVMKGECAMEA